MRQSNPFTILTLLALTAGAAATLTKSLPANAQEPTVAAAELPSYILGADDQISISVSNHTDLNQHLTILSDGKITFPEVGEVQAAGKTTNQLAAILQKKLEDSYNNVSVYVSVVEIRSRRVTISGPLKAGGVFELKPNWHLVDLISAAGGLTTRPIHVTGSLIRHNQEIKVVPLNIVKALDHPDSDANLPLLPNDLVSLKEDEIGTHIVSVVGAVNRPGTFSLEPETTVLSLLAQADGATERAALSEAYVRRGDTSIPLNLLPAVGRGRPDEAVLNFKLKPGDQLTIPDNPRKYLVYGAVARPGSFIITEKDPPTVLKAFIQAGGQVEGANLRDVQIRRQVSGKMEVIPVNLDDVRKHPEKTPDPAILPDDTLYIPAHHAKTPILQDILAPVSILSLFGFRIFR